MENIKTLVTEREDGPEDGSTLRTPAGETNVQVVTMSWYTQVFVRVARSYIQNVIAYLASAGFGVSVATAAISLVEAATGEAIPPPARTTLQVVIASLFAGLMPAFVCALHNAFDLLTSLDITNPKYRA